MAHYASIHFLHQLEGRPPALLARSAHLTPVSLFGVARQRPQDEIFIAGFALELLMDQLFHPEHTSRIDVARTPASARPYLERIASTHHWERFSPFEIERAEITQMTSDASLGDETFAELEAWQANHTRTDVVSLHAIDLAAADGPWDRCLSVIVDATNPHARHGLPFVRVTATRVPNRPELTEIRVTSSGSPFLRDALSMGPRMGHVEADENLARFTRFCGALARANPGLEEAILDVDGRVPRENESTLRETISAEIGIPCASVN